MAEIPTISGKEISEAVLQRLMKYEGLNFLETFAMFMGNAQILEISLKQFMHQRYQIELDRLDRCTLGQVSQMMKQKNVRTDFVTLLDTVVNHRNYIAHELLASQFMLLSLGATGARFEVKRLELALYELEQCMFLFEFTETANLWG